MKSTLAIDGVILGYFKNELNTHQEHEALKNALAHFDFQDTECDNETECYFYFPNTISMDEMMQFGHELHKMLGVDDTDYEWMVEDQTEEGNPEIRLEIICSLAI